KAEGLPLSADVGIHHLLLTDRDIGYFDPQFRFSPPLRSPRDREALGAAVIDGTIDAIASDHTPVDDDEKNVPFGEAAPGATGLELLLPLALKWAEQMQWRDADVLARITAAPAALLGLPCGTLAAGAPADLCIYDPAAFWAVTRETLRSQGKNSPWLRREMQAKVVTTLVAGRVVYAA
ncbi:MAG TPA: amidohydrolase family protein, partial [Usitatibacteraceae bacterium]|nr:amidohydrolase family protein [Usitatibacteraceae bacterium]